MIHKYPKLLLILTPLFLFIIQCNTSDNRIQPDLSRIAEPPPTIRLEQELYKIPKNQTKEGLDALRKKYPELMEYYLEAVMNIQDTSKEQSDLLKTMDEFIHHPFLVKINDTIQIVFKDFEKYENDLHTVVKNYKYYFPKSANIQLVTYTAGIGPKTFYQAPYLGIGLDLYMGHDFPYYPSQGLPDFMIKRFQTKYMGTDAAFTLITSMIEDPLKRGSQMIDLMTYYGKIYYIASYLLPTAPIEDFFYYSKEDWKWCVDNEKEIWSFLIEGEWLYNTKFMDYRKFIEDAPYTLGMPQGAPDRVARWVGYKIISAYMKKYPKTSFEELIRMDMGQKILTESKYKP